MQFNSEQLKAIKHGDGPALVIAGPGSGKTAVLTNRIKYLIEDYHVKPENILVITFSKAASAEMQNRFINLCGENFYPVSFGTFHSVFFQIIHSVYNYNTSNIMNLRQKREAMRYAIKASKVLDSPENEMIDSLINEVSFYKNNNEKAEIKSATNISNEQFKAIYKEYRNAQISQNKIDFEDMLLIVRNLFSKKKELLKEYQQIYKYILIDEYQDINSIQYEIVKMIAGSRANLWVCGDDDQSIYGFRGSNPEYMLGFKLDYPGAEVYRLNVNYRCSNAIIAGAGRLISDNVSRFHKEITGSGNKEGILEIRAAEGRKEEYELIREVIIKNRKKRLAVLVRTNAEASRYADILRGSGVKCVMEEKAINPYDNMAYKIFYNYLKLAQNGIECMDIQYLLPVLNKPVRYIRRDSISGNYTGFSELYENNKGRRNMSFIIKTFEYHMKKLMEFDDLYSGINYIRKGIGIDNYIKEEFALDDAIENYMNIADWLQDSSRNFADIDEMNRHAQTYSDNAALSTLLLANNKKKREDEEDTDENMTVEIMTYHASKGLEFDVVILPHVNEGTVPHKKAVNEAVEEERRLFYVAMTRAKDSLYITFLKGKGKELCMPSRFLYSLQRDEKKKEIK